MNGPPELSEHGRRALAEAGNHTPGSTVPGSVPLLREPGTADGSPVPGTAREPSDLGDYDDSEQPTGREPQKQSELTVPGSVPPMREPQNRKNRRSEPYGSERREPPREPQKQSELTVPGSRSRGTEPGTVRYVDVAALLDGTLPEPPAPDLLRRSDSNALFYAGQVNLLFGDPESGKTWVALAAVEEALREGRTALVVDLDHNGPAATLSRLVALGAPVVALRDPSRFLYCEPDDRIEMAGVVAHMAKWHPGVAVVDSIGELLPLFGSSSNSADEFTTVHTRVLKPLARSGAAVLAVDHLAKGQDSRAHGPGGTAAKRRAIGGVSVRVKVKDAFTPGHGGAAYLSVNKDRHGGLRAHCPTGDREPLAGVFKLNAFADGVLTWTVAAPVEGERNPDETAPPSDVAAVNALDPPPSTVDDAQTRLRWNRQRTAHALKAWREQPAGRTA